MITGKPDDHESIMSGLAGGRRKRTSPTGTSLAAHPTRRPTGNYADSEFLLSLTVPSKPGYAMHWNPSGRPGSNPDPMGSDRAAPATTR
jgi:hypothetical protein